MAFSGGEELTGMILRSMPIGEYDRRVEILTREKGKISAFARGSRKPGSPLMASASPFVFGRFRVFFGRSSNQLLSAQVQNYFETLRADITATCYGSYFMEILEYCTAENMDADALLILGYQALRALSSEKFDNRLVRGIFEIKAVTLEGEFEAPDPDKYLPATIHALHFLWDTPPAKVYSFGVSEEVLRELLQIAGRLRKRTFPHHFQSLDILEVVAK